MKFYKLEDGSDARYLGMEDSVPDNIIEQLPELISNGLIDTSYEKTYSEEEYQLAINPPTPTWENTLSAHTERSGTEVLLKAAFNFGYTYFAWNARIFKVTNYHQRLDYEMVEDVYEIDFKIILDNHIAS